MKKRVAEENAILAEGGVVEVIRRSYPAFLDPWIANAGMIYSIEGQRILGDIYQNYIKAAGHSGLPALIFAPTWRCQPERLNESSFSHKKDINSEAVQFALEVADDCQDDQSPVYVGAIVGCKGNPYKVSEGLTEDEAYAYHQWQIDQLSATEADVIQAATLPCLPEARGICRRLAETGKPYIISFMISPTGHLLDGTSISQAIQELDALTASPPLFYMCNCIHPDHFRRAALDPVNDARIIKDRLRGLQANTSLKRPDELDDSDVIDAAESPWEFAKKMAAVCSELDLCLLGGCCGTDERHMRFLAEAMTERN